MGELITSMLGNALYGGLVLTLIVCGMGVPIPEEVTFISAGLIGAKHGANIYGLCACGLIGIMLGDSVPFIVGRRYGLAFLSHRWFAKIVKPNHIEKTQKFFEKRGSKAVFFARFLAGLRMPTFFMAGSMGMSYWTFFFWDFLGALISCPISIYLAYFMSEQLDKYMGWMHAIIYSVTALVALVLLVQWLRHRKKSDVPAAISVEQPPAAVVPAPLVAESRASEARPG